MSDMFKVTLVRQSKQIDPKTGRKKRTRKVISDNYKQSFKTTIKKGSREMKFDMNEARGKDTAYEFNVKIHRGEEVTETTSQIPTKENDSKFSFDVLIHKNDKGILESVEEGISNAIEELFSEIEEGEKERFKKLTVGDEIHVEEGIEFVDLLDEEIQDECDEVIDSEEEEEVYPDDSDNIVDEDIQEEYEETSEPEEELEEEIEEEYIEEKDFDEESEEVYPDDADEIVEDMDDDNEDDYLDLIPKKYRKNINNSSIEKMKKINIEDF